MKLSTRALKYLDTQERFSSTVDRDQIIDAFKSNKAPIFEPLIDFQQKYSGYIFYAGLTPISFGILQGDGGYPKNSGTAIVEFFETDDEICKYQFICASTQYQMEFTLDENGRYFEDCKVVASSFEKTIEHLAIWDEIKQNGNYKIIKRQQQLVTTNIDHKLDLKPIVEASDEYTLWFANEHIFMSQWNGLTSIIASNDFDISILTEME